MNGVRLRVLLAVVQKILRAELTDGFLRDFRGLLEEKRLRQKLRELGV